MLKSGFQHTQIDVISMLESTVCVKKLKKKPFIIDQILQLDKKKHIYMLNIFLPFQKNINQNFDIF